MHGYVDIKGSFVIKTLYTAFIRKYDSDYYYDGEYHNFWEIVVVLDGEIGACAGKDVFLLRKGQAILHEPMEFHRLWSENLTSPTIAIFTFAADNMPKFSSKIFDVDADEAVNVFKEIADAYNIFAGDVKSIKNIDSLDWQRAVKDLERYILSTVSKKYSHSSVSQSKTAKNYAIAVNILTNNIDKSLGVSEIARLCNMSEINLKKTFSRYAGVGVMNYFNHLKITAAMNMLEQGMTVSEVSDTLGFSNQNYFSTVFRRITGYPPSLHKQKERH